MARRMLTDFLDAYIEYTKDTEPVLNYHLWSAVSAIAGALERKVYIKWGHQEIYPNLYVVLVGPAGWARKGTAIDLIRPIMDEAGIKLMSGAITMERLTQRLKSAIETYTDPTSNKIKFQCAVTFISPELQVFLRDKGGNVDLLARLTDLYDCPDPWVYDTKGQGTDFIQGPFFNLLAATAPEWIKSMLPDPAIGGGFTRRIIWVVEEDKRTKTFPTVDEELKKKLINDLQVISLLAGQAKLSDDFLATYKDWYEYQDKEFREGNLAIADPRFGGYCATRATILRKLSLILCTSESNNLIVERKHFERALRILEQAEKRMPRAFQSMGQARYADAVEKIFSFIHKKKKVSKAEVLRWLYRDIDESTYNIVVNTLLRMEVIEVITEKKGKADKYNEFLVLKKGAEEVFNIY